MLFIKGAEQLNGKTESSSQRRENKIAPLGQRSRSFNETHQHVGIKRTMI